MDRWLTFDCFGTLIDWRHGIRTTGELLFPGRGQDFLDAYITLEAEVEGEGSFKRYRAVLTETTRRAARQLALDLKPDDATALVSTIPHWPPFADVGPALAELRRDGWRFALLTNCDRDIIALTQRRLPASFDAVVTAEDVSAWHPDGHLVVDCSAPHARRRHGARACPRCQRVAGAPLPDLRAHVRAINHLAQLDVGPLGEGLMTFEMRTQLEAPLSGHGLAKDDAVRVAHRNQHRLDAAGRRVQLDLVRLTGEIGRQVRGAKRGSADVEFG